MGMLLTVFAFLSLVSADISNNTIASVVLGCTLDHCLCGYHDGLPVVTYGKVTQKSILAKKVSDGSIDVRAIYLWHTWDGNYFYIHKRVSRESFENWDIIKGLKADVCSSTDFNFAHKLQTFVENMTSSTCKFKGSRNLIIAKTPFGPLAKHIIEPGPLVNAKVFDTQMVLTYAKENLKLLVQGKSVFAVDSANNRIPCL